MDGRRPKRAVTPISDPPDEAPPPRKRRSYDTDHGAANANANANANASNAAVARGVARANNSNIQNVGSNRKGNNAAQAAAAAAPQPLPESTYDPQVDPMGFFHNLPPLPKQIPPVKALTKSELQELEKVLEFHVPGAEDEWKDDWMGNLTLLWKEVLNPNMKSATTAGSGNQRLKTFRQALLEWATRNPTPDNLRLVQNLLRHVVTQTSNTPSTVKRLFGTYTSTSSSGGNGSSNLDIDDVLKRVRRASYDPKILVEDGWTVVKSDAPEGATGGAYLIGDMIVHEGSDCIILAYVHDVDLGDLWKAVCLNDLVSFDVEAEELMEYRRKWEKRNASKIAAAAAPARPVAELATAASAAVAASLAASSASTTSRNQKSVQRNALPGNNNADFSVNGLEHGIVLAASYAKGARPNVYWPARIMHASEGGWDAIGGTSSNNGGASNGGTGLNVGGSSVRRNMSRQKVDVVFLAPYWKQDEGSGRTTTTLAAMDESTFNAVPLFQVESVDAVDDVLKEYPYAWSDGIDLTQLTKAFRFTGLPRAALPRYINAHRLAAALRNYAKHNIPNSGGTANDRATAGLFETHSMSVKTPNFPSVILHLPFDYILYQLPRSLDDGLLGSSRQSNNSHVMEPVLNLGSMVKAMNPPHSWGAAGNKADEDLDQNGQSTPDKNLSPASLWTKMGEPSSEMDANPTQPIDEFMKDFPALNDIFNQYFSSPPLVGPLGTLSVFLLLMENLKDGKEMDTPTRQTRLQGLITTWASWKRQGEDNLAYLLRNRAKPAIVQWRRAAEKLYRLFLTMLGDDKNLGSGLSVVISDTRCNGHRTSGGCFERPVRLPAALKGARLAGVGSNNSSRLITEVPARYIDMVESKLLARAHTSQYLKRMKSRCAAASSDDEVLVLTDNSEGEGGTDTSKFVMKVLKWFCVCVANTHPSHNVVPCETLGMAVGSRGTWLAAVTGVAAAVAAADMVVHGHCVNAFCMARPPGHHAGRSIHAMKAVSNGYCVLNAVAVTALYAVTAVAEGGLGLGRVCVLDFDAHHGNGTQDILCSTYDPRFFYVSLHAGGAQVNGHPKEDDPNHELHDLSDDRKQSGIYPGRCGDTSPHAGVLNIPMGPRVTGQAVGQVLIERVLPQIEAFSPDLLILSAGFDAHKSDPMELGTLSAADFGHITELACDVAFKTCSGRVVSVLEGGYGVPCCRIQKDTFLPKVSPPTENVRQENLPQAAAQNPVAPPEAAAVARLESGIANSESNAISKSATSAFTVVRKPTKLIDLGDDLPDDMDDQVPAALQNRLEKCHAEGFVECVSEHVKSLLGHNKAKQN